MTGEPTGAKRVAIVLLDGFSDWEIGLFAAAARAWIGATVRHVTPGGAPVRSMGGLVVASDGAVEALAPGDHDALLLIGSSAWESPEAPDLRDVIADDLAAGRPVGAICGGTVALARAGLLRGRRHTSNAPDYLSGLVPDYGGAETYRDTPRAVVDGSLVTAPGTAPVSFAAALVDLIWPGHPVAGQLRTLMAAEHADPDGG